MPGLPAGRCGMARTVPQVAVMSRPAADDLSAPRERGSCCGAAHGPVATTRGGTVHPDDHSPVRPRRWQARARAGGLAGIPLLICGLVPPGRAEAERRA